MLEAEQETMAAAIERAALESAAAGDDQNARARLYELLMGARVLIATGPDGRTAASHALEPGTPLTPYAIVHKQVGKILPVFTRPSALRASLGGRASHYAVLEMKQLLSSLTAEDPDCKILINPRAAGTIALNAQEIAHLARSRTPTPAGGEVIAQTTVQIAPVAALPPEPLLGALRTALAGHQDIEAAWAYRMRQGGLPPETVIGIVLAPGATRETEQAAVQHVIARATAACEDAKPLVYLVVPDSMRRGLEAGSGIELYRR
ncbi:SseB family protein [Actinospica durhamensis]|uniref:SseB family protein n=1 Tax=Actinospica durhamensis TaxID=1508375 RepID=A0A941IQQ2_9ACTN|nr:SseB family protein [Actinospica durhamensis]MBR7836504.1 SseB family protein [Actinospica durhamensis]